MRLLLRSTLLALAQAALWVACSTSPVSDPPPARVLPSLAEVAPPSADTPLSTSATLSPQSLFSAASGTNITASTHDIAPGTTATSSADPELQPWSHYFGSSRIQLAAIQTLCDRENFSPGVIDGLWGPKSRAALAAWQNKHGLQATGEPDAATFAAMEPLHRAFSIWRVAPEDHEGLAPVPQTWLAKSQVARLGYETVEEALSERFHCSRALLRFLNPKAAWPNPPPGTELMVPNPRPFKTPLADRLEIKLSEKTLRAYDATGTLIALFPCSIGRDRAKQPRGQLVVTASALDPTYFFDPAIFWEDPEARALNRKLIIPPGPNNPVGVAWISLSLPGYGIHGTPFPEDVGKTESHGCFRLANWNAAKLVRMVRLNTKVIIED